jgi:MFS family permease
VWRCGGANLSALPAQQIPIFYQVTRDYTATKSGVALLPFMLAVVLSVVSSGQIVARTGRYWPWLVIGPPFAAVGSGLLYTAGPSTSEAKLIGYMILSGIGIGVTMQNSLFAMQAEFRAQPKLVGQATGMATFGQFLGGTIGLAVAEAAFSSQLGKNLVKYAPDVNKAVITETPTNIYTQVPTAEIASVIVAYCKSLDIVVSCSFPLLASSWTQPTDLSFLAPAKFVLGVPFAAIALALAMGITNADIRPPEKLAAAKKAKEEKAAKKRGEVVKSAGDVEKGENAAVDA